MGSGLAKADGSRRERTPVDDRLATLASLTRWRLVVGMGALALGVLLRPGMAIDARWPLLGAGCAFLLAVTGAYALLVMSRRGALAQAWTQVVGD